MLNIYKVKQKGYILVLALIVMLFIGAIVISTVNTTSTEERVATSNLHMASLESALYQGMYTVEAFSKRTVFSDDTDDKKMCTEVNLELTNKLKNIVKEFQVESSLGADVFWKVYKLKSSCNKDAGEEQEITFDIIAWQGIEKNPITQLKGQGRIFINQSFGEDGSVDVPATGEVKGLKGVAGELQKIMGKEVATSTGNIKVALPFSTIVGDVKSVGKTSTSWFGTIKKGKVTKYDNKDVNDPLKLALFVDSDLLYTNQAKTTTSKLSALDESTFKFKSGTGNFDRNLGERPITRGVLTPEGLTVYDASLNIEKGVELSFYTPVKSDFLGLDKAGNPIKIAVIDKLTMNRGGVWINGSKPTLRVSGGDIVLYIQGDVLLGGFSKLHIDNDSSLTLIVDGIFTMSGLFEFTNQNITNNKGAPLFTLLSNGGNRKILKAVNIMGIRPIYGMIYAVSDITVSGFGDVQGQVFGNNITATLGGSIRLREFGRVSDDSSSGSSTVDTGTPGGGGAGGTSGSGLKPKLDLNFEIIY